MLMGSTRNRTESTNEWEMLMATTRGTERQHP